jgi:hypothetical protein
LLKLARTRRPRRSGEWTEAKAVTFIVTLAASRSVTLAAARAGMSRKAAYALKRRDPAFASAWVEALSVPAPRTEQGDKGNEVGDPRVGPRRGYSIPLPFDRLLDAKMRAIFFSIIANRSAAASPAPLARDGALP